MKKLGKRFVEKLHNIYLLSFLLPLFMMLGLIITRGVFPFGKNSFMFSDMYHQYVPFLTGFYDKLHGGESFAYTFRIGLGTNYTSVFAYYLASPVNWLCYFCKREYLMEFLTCIILLKSAMCGLTFCFYLSRHFERKETCMVWFAVFYSMSGFMAAYYWNHMWLDIVWLAPLVVLGLEELILKGRIARYVTTLAVAILTNYYLSIILCVFLVLYFLLYLFTNGLTIKKKVLACIRFATSSLLAGGMAGALLFPVYYSMQDTGFLSNSLPKKIEVYFDFLSVLARHIPFVPTERKLDHWPNIYCGVFVLILIPMYLFSAKIKLRKKIGHILLLGIFYAAFSVNILNFIWHGMNYPNSLPARQSFLYILVVLTLCCEAVLAEKETKKAGKIAGFVTGCLLLILCGIFVTTEGFTVELFACAWVFLAGYFVLKVVFAKIFAGKKWSKVENWAILLLVCVEALMNLDETAYGTTVREKYADRQKDYARFYELAKEDSKEEPDDPILLFRMDNDKPVTKNDASLSGYSSLSVFSSTTNDGVRDFYDKLGMGNSKVTSHHEGATAFAESLFSMRYRISDKNEKDTLIYRKIADNGRAEDDENARYLYRNAAAFPIGFFLSKDTVSSLEETLSKSDVNAISMQNGIGEILGEEEPLFITLTGEERIRDEEKSVLTIQAKKDGCLYAYIPFTPKEDVLFTKGEKEWKEEKLDSDNLYYLGYYAAGEEVIIDAGEAVNFYPRIYRLNEEALMSLSNRIWEHAFTESSHGENALAGEVDAKEDGYVLFTIPAEDGFEIFLDGKRVQTETFYDSMILVPVEKGTHEIAMRYRVRGLKSGFAVSAASIFVFLLYIRKRKGTKV